MVPARMVALIGTFLLGLSAVLSQLGCSQQQSSLQSAGPQAAVVAMPSTPTSAGLVDSLTTPLVAIALLAVIGVVLVALLKRLFRPGRERA